MNNFLFRYLEVTKKILMPYVNLKGVRYKLKRFYLNGVLLASSKNKNREPWMYDVLEALLSGRHGAFIDVGANFGQTLFKKLSIDKERPYVGFEPQLLGCGYIDEFIRENELSYHYVFPIALSNKAGIRDFGCSAVGDESASIASEFRPDSFYRSYKPVLVSTGDKIISELSITDVSAIKIDVEGAELEVLEGFNNTLDRTGSPVLFEVLSNFMKLKNKEIDADLMEYRRGLFDGIYQFLNDKRYNVFRIAMADDGCFELCSKIKPHKIKTQYFLALHENDKELEGVISRKVDAMFL